MVSDDEKLLSKLQAVFDVLNAISEGADMQIYQTDAASIGVGWRVDRA